MSGGEIGLHPDGITLIAYDQSMSRVRTGASEAFIALARVHSADSDTTESSTTDWAEADGMLWAHEKLFRSKGIRLGGWANRDKTLA